MNFAWVSVRAAAGLVLAHRLPGWPYKKGQLLTAEQCQALRDGGVETVQAVRLDPGDVGENLAAEAAAARLAHDSVRLDPATAGRVDLRAAHAGLVQVDAGQIDALNRLHEGLTVATLAHGAIAARGQRVATVKVIPYALPDAVLDRLPAAAPALQVVPFRARGVCLILGTAAGLKEALHDKACQQIAARLEQVGLYLSEVRQVPHETDALRAALASTRAPLILVLGASATADRADVAPAALVAAGGTIAHFGMPMDPGHLILTGRLDERPVLILPGCARSPAANGLDRVLARLAADLPIGSDYLQSLGVGGLLKAPPPRVPKPERPAAILLAAGQSRRMGGPDKLVLPVSGRAMVRHAADSLAAAGSDPIVAVVADRHGPVAEALAGVPGLQVMHNPAPERGMGASLALAAAAVPQDRPVFVALADMPKIRPDTLQQLAARLAGMPAAGIAVPVFRAQRGHPVLFAPRHLPALRALHGDQGARAVLQAHADEIIAVPVDDPGIHHDIDEPAAYQALVDAP